MSALERTASIPWWRPVMSEREKQFLAEVIDSNFPNDGPRTSEFESRIAQICGVPYAVAVTSGTSALFLAIVAAGIGFGDEVLVPDITFIATANAVRLAGATPVLVDVDPSTFCIDPESAASAITSHTKAIIPVHVSGRGAAMEAISKIATERDLFVIEDAAEALGSKRLGAALGSIGDLGCFSFSPNKTITTGQGGVVVTRDLNLHQRLRELKDQGRPMRGTGGDDEHPSLGYNFKFTDLQAVVGLAQLESFSERQDHLRRLYRLYQTGLEGNRRVRLGKFELTHGEVPQWVDCTVEDRDGLTEFLSKRRIGFRKFWLPLHTQAPYRSDSGSFESSIRVSREALWLPSAMTLTEEDVAHVCCVINEWSAR